MVKQHSDRSKGLSPSGLGSMGGREITIRIQGAFKWQGSRSRTLSSKDSRRPYPLNGLRQKRPRDGD